MWLWCVLAYSSWAGRGSRERVRSTVTSMNAVSNICLSSALLEKLHGKGGKKGCGMFLSYFLYSTSRQIQILRISQSLNSINLNNPCENQYFGVKKHRNKRGGKGKSYIKLNHVQKWDTSSFKEIVEALFFCCAQNTNVQLAFKSFWETGKEISRREVRRGSHPADGRRQQQGRTQIASPKRKFAVLLVGGAHPEANHSPESCQNPTARMATLPSPPQLFYLKPQRQADEKLEVWVTWVCSFARTVLCPHVPAPTLPVPNSATPQPPLWGPPITKVAAVQFTCLWLSWIFTITVPTTCCAFDVTFQLTFPEDL